MSPTGPRFLTPPAAARVLRRCLERDPRRRFHDIADARLELEDGKLGTEERPLAPIPRSGVGATIALAAAMAVAGAALATWLLRGATATPAEPILRFEIPLPEDTQLVGGLDLSPDGQRFLLNESVATATNPIVVVHGWGREIRRLLEDSPR